MCDDSTSYSQTTKNEPTESELQARLILLFQDMYEHTRSICKEGCRYGKFREGRCCESIWCEAAIEWSAEMWGRTLESTDHPTLPLMGEEGCTADPHLRPLCTIHQCYIDKWGFHPDSQEWTDRYFELRDEIDSISFKLFG